MRMIKPAADIPPLRGYQVEALKFARQREFVGLFMEPGTGKTKVSLELMGYMYRKEMIDTAFILAPNGVHTQWLEEQAPEHCPIPYRRILWSANRSVKWKDEAKYSIRKRDSLLIVAMNYEALTTKDGRNFAKWLLENRKVGVFADESSRIRNPKAIRTKFALLIGRLAARRVILTGTPVVKGFENLWSQMQFLSPDIVGCDTFVGFRHLYCKTRPLPGHRGVVMIEGYQRIDELMNKINPHIFIKKKVDCLDLPDKIYTRSPVEMSSAQEIAYQTMRDDLIVELSELEKVTVAHLISARAKLRQIAIGFILDANKNATTFPNGRFDRALEHIDEAPGKVILWSTFRWCLSEWERLLQKNKIGYVRYQKGNRAAIAEWRANPKTKVFLANPASGGIGLNLADADTMVYFNNTDDAEIRWQSEDRAHRIGQTQHLNIIDLYSPRTVEVKMQKQQANKESIADIVMSRGWQAAL